MLTRFRRWLAGHISSETSPVVVARIEMFRGGGCAVDMVPRFQMSLAQMAAIVNFMRVACGLDMDTIQRVENAARKQARSNVTEGPWIH